MFVINSDECIGCGICAYNCSWAAIHGDENILFIDATECNMCGDCTYCCPTDCIYDDGTGFPLEDPNSVFSPADFLNAIVEFVNTPFVMGGEDPITGADCSGLIWLTYCEMGLYYPRCSTNEFSISAYWTQVNDPQPGDIAVWPGHHSGIYFPYGDYNFYFMSGSVTGHPRFGLISWFNDWGPPIYFRYHHP